jgi:DNA-binding MarR family transcriptional regulator
VVVTESEGWQERDSIDAVLQEWASERPDLDARPVGIVARLGRLRAHLDGELAAVFDRYDLTPADFQVIVTLRRSGTPYHLPQARLMTHLGLTSGTVSVRVDRLVRNGIVVRASDDTDARITQVRLTEAGLRLFDEIAPVHLRNEDRLLSALDDQERDTLAGLLRRLLASLEHCIIEVPAPLGVTLEPAHRARARRQGVGLADSPGLLVTGVLPGQAWAAAGVVPGDLLVAVDGTATLSEGHLYAALKTAIAAALDAGGSTVRLHLLRGDQPLTLTATLAP